MKKLFKWPLGALLLLAISVVLPGCGDDGGASAESADGAESLESRVIIPWGPETVTRPEYLRRANGVCSDSWARMLESYRTRYGAAERGKGFDDASQGTFLPGMQFWFDDISYLDAPEGEKDEVEELLIALQLAVWKGQDGVVSTPAQFETTFAEYNRHATAYGLDDCLVEAASFRT